MSNNQVFEAAEIYLQTKISPTSNGRIRVSKTERQNTLSLALHTGEEIVDMFENIKLKWHYVCSVTKEAQTPQWMSGRTNHQSISHVSHVHEGTKRSFELKFSKKHNALVMDAYLPYVLVRAKVMREEEKILKLNSSQSGSVDLKHPSTFDTLAMDPELKRMIIEDLDRFVSRKEFYKKVGKAWKRGYLLYGPPGTGKSSLIAAMANYLKFDVYDLDLNDINDDHHLKRTLLSTSNRSILVIEDIDCSVQIENREPPNWQFQRPSKFSLSGLLNFIDGLWSSVGDERIIVFTTNHKDRLDPALLRPGRMDVHIHMSYCTPSGFRILASNYLDIHESNPHHLCGEIEGLIESTEVTPAEIAEELMKSDNVDGVLEGLVNFLKRKKIDRSEEKEEGVEIREEKRQKMQSTVENGSIPHVGLFNSGAAPLLPPPPFPYYRRFNT